MSTMPSGAEPPDNPYPRPTDGRPQGNTGLTTALSQLRRRVVRSANIAIDMLEASLHALHNADHLVAEQVRLRDDAVDDEEVWIEQECLRLLTLQRPYGQDFRLLAFCMKVNADIERVADHATSIAKVALQVDPDDIPQWPTALVELGDRVPVLCHTLLRAVLDEDVDAARALVKGDEVIDKLDKQLFEEIKAWIAARPDEATHAMLAYRLGRELERVGDLMTNIAEDIVYLVTGRIIRHQRDPADASEPLPPVEETDGDPDASL
ncbi:MAG: phosphate transport system regulatory protein PhoU [Phycisphaerae bacterium]|nr:phosphate transport system regulatory protein PhoU [Phycisphaerae bacterium]